MKLIAVSALAALSALSVGAQTAPPLPDQYVALGVSLNPGAAPPVQGDVEWGKLATGNTYLGMAAGIIPTTQGAFSLTTAQAVARQVAWQSASGRVALVVDGKIGIANSGNGNTGGAFTGAGGAVIGLHSFGSGKLSAYVGVKAAKTSLQPNSFGPAVGLVFTPK